MNTQINKPTSKRSKRLKAIEYVCQNCFDGNFDMSLKGKLKLKFTTEDEYGIPLKIYECKRCKAKTYIEL